MPNYEFVCPKCDLYDDRYISLADFDKLRDKQFCACGAKMDKQISVPMVIGTDTQMFLSKTDDGFGGDDMSRKIAKQKAAAAGVSTVGKTFVPGLCRHKVPYDPGAWVNDKAEVVKKAEKLGRNVEGGIKHFTPVRDADYAKVEAPYRVSPKVVAPEVAATVKQRFGPKATKQQVAKVFEEKIALHSGN
jgi:hypothetical protein